MSANAKKTMVIVSLLILIPAVFSAANGNRSVGDGSFNSLLDRKWYLTEVKKDSGVISIGRTELSKEIYTITFQANRIVGSGANNTYFAPYTAGANQELSIGMLASSRVAPLFEMKDFTEYEYFRLIGKVNRWNYHNEKLELYATDQNGDEVVLIFS